MNRYAILTLIICSNTSMHLEASEFVKQKEVVVSGKETRSSKYEEPIIEECGELIKTAIPELVNSCMEIQSITAELVDDWAYNDTTKGIKNLDIKTIAEVKETITAMHEVFTNAQVTLQEQKKTLTAKLQQPHNRARRKKSA